MGRYGFLWRSRKRELSRERWGVRMEGCSPPLVSDSANTSNDLNVDKYTCIYLGESTTQLKISIEMGAKRQIILLYRLSVCLLNVIKVAR